MVKNKDLEYTESKSYLMLEDGTVFEGQSFGAHTDTDGEIGKFANSFFLLNFLLFCLKKNLI